MIKVENISKQYRIGAKQLKAGTMAEAMSSFLLSPVRNLRRLRGLTTFKQEEEDDVIWALKDVSFEVKEGEVLGIIGRNGAGKSTLLKVLSRITPPTRGRVRLNGRVSSLLEVGTGFHQELTGRENIYLNGTILGMRKREVDKKFDEIVDFSGVEKFIDTPVKRYSSGMTVRLAFSVAAHLEPEILIVDEVLAVGDIDFQQKSFNKMSTVASQGRTILLVSHNMSAIRSMCDKAALLNSGEMISYGETNEIVGVYLNNNLNTIGDTEKGISYSVRPSSVKLCQVKVVNALLSQKKKFVSDENIHIYIKYEVLEENHMCRIGLWLYSRDGNVIFTSTNWDSQRNGVSERQKVGCYTERVVIPGNFLNAGKYHLSISSDWPMHKVHFMSEPVTEFEVLEMGAVGGAVNDRRLGYVRPILDWQPCEA